MKRRKFIIGTLAVLAVPMPPSFQTKPVETDILEDYRKYHAWFKEYYGESPLYKAPNGKFYRDNLLISREGWESPTPVYRKHFDGYLGLYSQEHWDIERKEQLESFKVITYEEYLKYIA